MVCSMPMLLRHLKTQSPCFSMVGGTAKRDLRDEHRFYRGLDNREAAQPADHLTKPGKVGGLTHALREQAPCVWEGDTPQGTEDDIQPMLAP